MRDMLMCVLDANEHAALWQLGSHVVSLRRVRGLTQEELAVRANLSPDTIRRLEHDSFSPSWRTVCKLCAGLDLAPETFIAALAAGVPDPYSEVRDLLGAVSEGQRLVLVRVLRVLVEELTGAGRGGKGG